MNRSGFFSERSEEIDSVARCNKSVSKWRASIK